ncbi:hypothetical protein ABT121_27740 [Streptomyces sp. NPDC001928]|uniref:hypothetical protein n=1 Tax=Streptomyces sp. NPDC001928 TaxID=3154404 RepID=UPI0033168E92
MHRTTTTATLLVTVAVSALGGCTTVQHPPVSGAPSAPSRPPVPRPGAHTDPKVVQAPAREALTLADPSRSPDATPSAAPPASPTPPSPARPAPRSPHSHPRQEHHEPGRPHSAPQGPKQPPVPDVSETLPKEVQGNGDICALGKKYGGWRPDSPESRICEQTYGQ